MKRLFGISSTPIGGTHKPPRWTCLYCGREYYGDSEMREQRDHHQKWCATQGYSRSPRETPQWWLDKYDE